MSYVIASERSGAPWSRRRHQPSHILSRTDCLDLSYDESRRALWIHLTERAPAYVSLELIQDLLGVNNVFATTLSANRTSEPEIDFKVIASKRAGVFSLGGDLASFRYFIDQGNRNAMTQYANAALDAIWTNARASVDGMTTVSLVQGEAQGGGFEAALSAHVLVAEKGAMFGFPEALFGMFPGMGGYALLSARTSAECARRLIGSTNRYPAEMLFEMGVVDLLAEPGMGQATLDEWMSNATEESTAPYRTRFDALDRSQLVDSIDEWVEQAMCLSQRQLRTMGYILEAQKRASAKPGKASVTPLRRRIEFADICTDDLVATTPNGTPSPLLVRPQALKRYRAGEKLAFIKGSRPWIYENLSQHGAVVLRGFADEGVSSINRLAAALRTDRTFKTGNAVPTPASVHDNLFEDELCRDGGPLPLHNAHSDCPVFPTFKLVSYVDDSETAPAPFSIANTRVIYESLDPDLIAEFERRGIEYRRRFPDLGDSAIPASSVNGYAWQHVFRTTSRSDVERRCRENGLSCLSRTDGGVEVYNSAPACITHYEQGYRLWFNQIHFLRAWSTRFVQQKSMFSKLFKIVKPAVAVDVRFSDGGIIPDAYFDAIDAAHRDATLEFALEPGDVLLLDNALNAYGGPALDQGQRCLFALF